MKMLHLELKISSLLIRCGGEEDAASLRGVPRYEDKPICCGRRGIRRTVVDMTRRIIRYGFVELLDDVSWWLVLGIVLSAIAVVAIPAQLFDGMWGGGIASMVLMLALSVPLYTCASCSTPMAAALALKGLSPGAVLVFL